jgi:hypothetical protein
MWMMDPLRYLSLSKIGVIFIQSIVIKCKYTKMNQRHKGQNHLNNPNIWHMYGIINGIVYFPNFLQFVYLFYRCVLDI